MRSKRKEEIRMKKNKKSGEKIEKERRKRWKMTEVRGRQKRERQDMETIAMEEKWRQGKHIYNILPS